MITLHLEIFVLNCTFLWIQSCEVRGPIEVLIIHCLMAMCFLPNGDRLVQVDIHLSRGYFFWHRVYDRAGRYQNALRSIRDKNHPSSWSIRAEIELVACDEVCRGGRKDGRLDFDKQQDWEEVTSLKDLPSSLLQDSSQNIFTSISCLVFPDIFFKF